jgi:putative toxin-antitoxin system antitoxin component (TIGR02293 family)
MTTRAKTKAKQKPTYYTSSLTEKPAPISYASRIGLRVYNELALADKVESGFSFAAFTRLQKAIEITANQLAELISITSRTLTRRKNKGRLRPDESERLLRVSRIFDLSLDLFEDDKKAAHSWLFSSNEALRGKTPLELSKTEVGAREVENLIHRLEHGVFT